MSNDTKNEKQALKELFFQNQDKLFSKKSKFISYTMKDTTSILSSIASKNNFSEIRKRYKVLKLISKILLKSQFNWILYAFYRNDTLYMATKNHIGQSELNLQKLTLIKYFKQSKDFSNIIKVSVFRDEHYKKEKKTNIIKDKIYKENSYGIFTNSIQNDLHKKIVEKIRKNILDINKK